MFKTYFNGTNSPLLIDNEGRTVGGGETIKAESTFNLVKRWVAAGYLLEIKEPRDDEAKEEAKESKGATSDKKTDETK